MKKLIAAISVITALGAGAFVLNAVLPAGASNTAVTQTASTSSGAPSSDPSSKCAGPRAKFKGVLDGLVHDGTIDQTQEDKIIQAFKDAAPANKPDNGRRGKGFEAAGHPVVKGMVETAADAIHIAPADLVSALQSGKSVADVANDHGVKPADVVQAIVDAGNAKIDQAVTNGKITQDRADKMKSHLSDAATKFVNHTRPEC
jgi:uncharacterized protein (DUF433 family)